MDMRLSRVLEKLSFKFPTSSAVFEEYRQHLVEIEQRITRSEKFPGDTPELIEQDFYVTIFLSNMASLVQQEADEMISKEHDSKSLKYDYVANCNILIGKLKEKLVKIILERSSKKRKQMYKKLLKEIQQRRGPIRPGRKFSRKITRLQANKNCLNQRTCI